MLPQILLFLKGYGVRDKLNVPKYFKQINLVGATEKYVGNIIKNNSIEFYIYLLSNYAIQGP